MEIRDALDQIAEIHGHLAKGEVYRGYRALPVALSGVVALVAAKLQPLFIGEAPGGDFVWFWLGVAVVAGLTAGGGIIFRQARETDPVLRRRTHAVVGQFLPSLLSGVPETVYLARTGASAVAWLPGLWAILFSLGIFASRIYLPRIIGFIALGYLAAGVVLLALVERGASLSPWGMGLTFGLGQILGGAVLYWNLERG